jgi:hypothetical protein
VVSEQFCHREAKAIGQTKRTSTCRCAAEIDGSSGSYRNSGTPQLKAGATAHFFQRAPREIAL